LALGFLNLFVHIPPESYTGLIYSILIIVAILASVIILIGQNKKHAGYAIRQNKRLKSALMAGNLTLVTLNLNNMTIEQETPFTYEGEEPESFGGPVNFDDLINNTIHPQDHHIIRDTIHEFQHEGAEETHVDLRVIHEGLWLWFRFYISLDAPQRLVILGQMIHHEKTENEELYRKANFDALTNLVNRHYCYSYLEKVLEKKRRRDFPMAIAYIDADSLKQVNDQLGHIHGDQYLMDMANTLSVGIREDDILGRIGGDEFLLVCPGTSEDEFNLIKARIERELEQLNHQPSRAYKLSFSMGFIEVESSNNYTVDQLLEEADNRMYEIKKKKKALGQGIKVVK
jgi:diguanylate cyclase (GGDEF)-like protein